jgi:hypothetical protein
MIPALRIYQYVAPALLAPLSFYLWWVEYGNLPQVLMAWLIPVLWAYIVPAVGTNVCKVWELDVRWRLGRFRPHHGFVFGSATAMLAWLVHQDCARNSADVARFALILCSVLGFWNLLYDVKALRIGLLKVYNQPWADGRGEEAIALDYAPWFFGGFGAAYGAVLGGFEYLLHTQGRVGAAASALWLTAGLLVCIALPVGGFIRHSLRAHGHAGTWPVPRGPSP